MIDLRLGDCLEILPTLADKCADAIITDLPYGTTACSWDVVIPFAPMWKQVKRLCRGAFVTTASQPFTSLLITSALDMFRYEWCWDKHLPTGHLDANRKPMKRHENVCVFSSNGHTYNPQKWMSKPYKKGLNKQASVYGSFKRHAAVSEDGSRYPTTIIDISGAARTGEHPTQKPVALYEYLIQTYTNPGDTVLDFTMGSGTTGVACVRLNRNFIGIEKKPEYFEIAQRRISEAQQMAVGR
jgi:site-specific DNA-methyltransferase (adenine-specific)